MPNLVLAESELLPVLHEAFEGWGWKGKVKEIPSCHFPLHNYYCAVIAERFKIIIIVECHYPSRYKKKIIVQCSSPESMKYYIIINCECLNLEGYCL